MNEATRDDRERNYFAITAGGRDFDVDQYLQNYPLTVRHLWRRGELRADSMAQQRDSGFSVDLGCGAELPIEEQQEIAVAFLVKNEVALTALKAIPTVETFYLGIQEEVLQGSGGSLFDLDPLLMQTALRIGIQLTVWALLQPKSGCELPP